MNVFGLADGRIGYLPRAANREFVISSAKGLLPYLYCDDLDLIVEFAYRRVIAGKVGGTGDRTKELKKNYCFVFNASRLAFCAMRPKPLFVASASREAR